MIPFLIATVTTSLMFVGRYNEQSCAYMRLGVSFEGHSDIDWLWRCKVSFGPLNKKEQPFSPSPLNYAGCFRSRVEMIYEFNPSYEKEARDKQNAIFADNKKENTIETTNFTFKHRGDNPHSKKMMERLFGGAYTLMSWQTKVNSLYDALETVQKMQDTKGNFPMYNLAGYEFFKDGIVLNGCGFSVKLLNSLDVPIDDYLKKYITRNYTQGPFGWIKTYLIDGEMRALIPERAILHLLKTNSSEYINGFYIYPYNILSFCHDFADEDTKHKLELKRREERPAWPERSTWKAENGHYMKSEHSMEAFIRDIRALTMEDNPEWEDYRDKWIQP